MRNLSNRAIIFGLIIFYALIRVASFLTFDNTLAQGIISALLVLAYLCICVKNISLAWIVLISEILLDGSGRFFEFNQLILRTWFLAIFAIVWLIKKAHSQDKLKLPPKNVLVTMVIFGLFLTYSIINGFLCRHAPLQIVQDAMLYLFFLLIFPALDYTEIFKPIYASLSKVFTIGTAIFSVITLFLYSTGIFIIMNPYYHWFRNVAGGKITDMGQGFFRIVLPEHLLIIPIFLVLTAYLIRKPKSKYLWGLLLCAGGALALNFTRIYFVGLAVGLLALVYRENFWQWLKFCALTVGCIILLFFSFNLIASRGQSMGLNLVGIKAAGISQPSSDVSGAIRKALLPDIFRTIKNSPLLGSGLGTTVTYVDPVTKETQTRTQFDWGYLEMITELGIIGTLAYLALLCVIMLNLFHIISASNESQLAKGLLAGAVALFIINITTPALFQGFGVIYFVLLIVANRASSQLSPAPPHIS